MKRILSLILILALLATAFSACSKEDAGGQSTQPQTSAAPEGTKASEPPAEPPEVSVSVPIASDSINGSVISEPPTETEAPTEPPEETEAPTEPPVEEPERELSVYTPELTVSVPTADNCRVFYEIFVGSFSDSDGDGIGDLRGIINRMDYLNDGDDNSGRSLGIEGLWLTPIFQSPTYHKYDVTDFYTVDPKFGTTEDLKELVDLCHERNVKVILDLPINHTAKNSPWFTAFAEAQRSGDTASDAYDFYSHCSAEDRVYGISYAKVAGTDEFYECNFWTEMPELNFDSEAVRQAVLDVAKYYLELGIDGFRFDAAKYIYFNDNNKSVDFWTWYMDELRAVNPEIYVVGEVWDSDLVVQQYYAALNCFNFSVSQSQGLLVSAAKRNEVDRYTSYVSGFLNAIREKNDSAIYMPFIANHDTDRAGGYLSSSDGTAQMAANLLLLGPGSPFLYYGEELGMQGSRGSSNTDANRRLAMAWGDEDQVKDPDGATTPVDGRVDDTAANQIADLDSLYTYYKRVIQIRKANPEIARGEYIALALPDTKVGGFCSVWNGKAVCVLHNSTNEKVRLDLNALNMGMFSDLNAAAGRNDASLDGGVLTIGAQTSVVLRTADGFTGELDLPTTPEETGPVDLSAGTWSVIGSVSGTNWDTDFDMEKVSDNVFELQMELSAGNELKVRMDGSWEINFGADGLRDGVNLVVSKSGSYIVRLTIYDEDFGFLQIIPSEQTSNWGVIGTIYGTNWDVDFSMTQVEPGVYEIELPGLYAGEEYKVRKNNGWEINFGADGSRDGPNAIVPADGDYVLRLSVAEDERSAVLELNEKVPVAETAVWSVIGTIYETEWDTDFDMTKSESGVYEIELPGLHAGEEFKVRKNGSWDVNFGADGNRDGPNAVVPADGDYRLLLTVDDFEGFADLVLERTDAETAASAWSVIGSIYGTAWDTDFDMTQTEPGVYMIELPGLHAGEELKVRKDCSWEINFGADGSRDGPNVVVTADGDYTLYLTVASDESWADLDLEQVIAQAEPSAWGMIGSIYGTNWDTDFPMYENEPGIFEAECYGLHAGEELKVRKDGSWEINFGADGSRDGPNLVVPADGDYMLRMTVAEDESYAVVELLYFEG